MNNVIKRDGRKEPYNFSKIEKVLNKTFYSTINEEVPNKVIEAIKGVLDNANDLPIETIQDIIEDTLIYFNYSNVAKAFILYREKHKNVRNWVEDKKKFIEKYKVSTNTADATIDDNSNVGDKNIGVLNTEIHKSDNILISRGMILSKLKELYPDFDYKNYIRDLESHIIYKHDESSFAGAISPYCCSITMYPFLLSGMENIGGLSASPKNLDSFCGMYINLVFATSAMFAGAVATSEFLLYFDYFARKEWGNKYFEKPEEIITSPHCQKQKTIRNQIHQHFQQVIYSINQPAAARGLQAAFINFSYFDKPFFEGMFGEFIFPDGTSPIWESLNWLQQEFMRWFNKERLKTILTFPVESFALVYKNGKFEDEESAKFVADEYARGHSFFTYISDTVDSLSSCCFSKDTVVLAKSSKGIHWDTFENLKNIKTNNRKNFTIFHNGSWCSGRIIKLPNRKMYKITTANNKEIIVSDNHLNPTLRGDIETAKLTNSDYLLFNTNKLDSYPEADSHLTYEQGFAVGAFIGDGSFGTRHYDGTIYDVNYSQNRNKYELCMKMINRANYQLDPEGNRCRLSKIYNNVYPVRISSKHLVSFIQKWTNWKEGTKHHNKELNMDCLLQSYEFRKGILDGWYNTDGGNSNRCYTTSKKLIDCMELLITSLGLNSTINISDRTDEKVIIRGEEYNRKYPLYCIRWYDAKNRRSMKDVYIHKNNSIYFKIKSIKEVEYYDDIYCFEMENQNEPYFTLPNGLITHNCRLKNKIQTKEFNFTNGNIGVQTGSKSVITLNLNRVIQNCVKKYSLIRNKFRDEKFKTCIKVELIDILSRVYKYHEAYNELLWDMYNSNLLPIYKAGFINLNKQYLTIGINGLNEAAEFLEIKCSFNPEYEEFCQLIFSTIKEENKIHKTSKTTYNTECVPAESLAIKNYNWDKEDNYWVPENRNLYASYIYIPSDPDISVLEQIKLHGNRYIGDYLDGGAACHINLNSHLSSKQYQKLLEFAAKEGCQYLTFNIPNSKCTKCGYITKVPIEECPVCGGTNIDIYDRVIGYLTPIKNWSSGRQKEQKTRIYKQLKTIN